MERETKTIKTPLGRELVLKTYLTARERNELRRVYLDNMEIGAEEKGFAVKEMKGSVVEELERKLIGLVVVSYDGSKENVFERLLDATPEEYDFVVDQANKVSVGFWKAK